jgi:hypothetical protein
MSSQVWYSDFKTALSYSDPRLANQTGVQYRQYEMAKGTTTIHRFRRSFGPTAQKSQTIPVESTATTIAPDQ